MSRDPSTLSMGFSAPGSDPRGWVSYGTVDPDTANARSVTFTKEYGPLVNVTLSPSAVPARCRVAREIAGAGEAAWDPFVAGDEVLVVIPEGSEDAGCCIIGRLNQELDAWPMQVAGMDATANNFGFKRMRYPYVIETSSNFLIRDATTGAFFGLKDGAVTIGEGDGGYLAISPDFIGLQTGDAKTLLQLDVANKRIIGQANGAQLTIDGAGTSLLYTHGTLQLAASGNQATGHALTLEQLLGILTGLFTAVVAVTGGSSPLTGSTLAEAVIAAFTAPSGPTSALTLATALPTTPYALALQAALSVPAMPSASLPGVACPGILLG